MTTPLTDEELDAARALEREATPGEWTFEQRKASNGTRYFPRVRISPLPVGWGDTFGSIVINESGSMSECVADARFIAASRTLVPRLLATIEALKAEVERLRARLERQAAWLSMRAFSGLEENERLRGEVERLTRERDAARDPAC